MLESASDSSFHQQVPIQIQPFPASAGSGFEPGFLFFDDQPVAPLPILLPDQASYKTHRTVTPVLLVCDEASRSQPRVSGEFPPWEHVQPREALPPSSDQSLEPDGEAAVFSGTVSPVVCSSRAVGSLRRRSEAAEAFPLGSRRVLSGLERTASNVIERKPRESPHPSDSDAEFFDCRQDFSEPEEELSYHISEPPSPRPMGSPDPGVLDEISRPLLRRLSSGSQSLGEFAYDSDVSGAGAAEGGLPMCEELPSRGQAGYYDEDDFLGMVRG